MSRLGDVASVCGVRHTADLQIAGHRRQDSLEREIEGAGLKRQFAFLSKTEVRSGAEFRGSDSQEWRMICKDIETGSKEWKQLGHEAHVVNTATVAPSSLARLANAHQGCNRGLLGVEPLEGLVIGALNHTEKPTVWSLRLKALTAVQSLERKSGPGENAKHRTDRCSL